MTAPDPTHRPASHPPEQAVPQSAATAAEAAPDSAPPDPPNAQPLPNDLAIPGLTPAAPPSRDWKQLFVGGVLIVTAAVTLTTVLIQRFGPKPEPEAHPGTAANAGTRVKFDPSALMAPPPPPPAAAAGTTAASLVPTGTVRVPSIEPADTGTGAADPISLRSPGVGPMGLQAGAAAPLAAPPAPGWTGAAPQPRRPADDSPFITAAAASPQAAGAPMAHPATAGSPLGAYQAQLDGMVRQLQAMTDQVTGGGTGAAASLPALPPITGAPGGPAAGSAASGSPALIGQLERSQTPVAKATVFGPRSLMLPKGVLFQCALKTRIVSAVSGFVGCQLQRHVYSDDGRVVLLERGSHLDGEYRIVQVRPGMTRIPVLWTRVRTPHGIVVDLDSPATGALGESGIGGDVHNRWPERIGAALLLSLIDDAIQVHSRDTTSTNQTVVLPNTTAAGSRLAEQVLASTINIPPLITAHPGSVVGVYVARDLDFTGVYRLEAR